MDGKRVHEVKACCNIRVKLKEKGRFTSRVVLSHVKKIASLRILNIDQEARSFKQ